MAAVPKLSLGSLQAQLRSGKAPAPKPSSAVSPQGLKRPAEGSIDGAPPSKMGSMGTPSPAGVAKARIAKGPPIMKMAPAAPGAVKSPGPQPGLQAKLPPPAPAAPQAPVGGNKANEIEDIKALQAKLAALKAKANSLQAELGRGDTKQVPKAATGAAVKSAPAPAPMQSKAAAPAAPVQSKAAAPPTMQSKSAGPPPMQSKAVGPASSGMPQSKSAAAVPSKAAALPVKRPPSAPPMGPGVGNGQQSAGGGAQDAVSIDTATAEALKTFATGLSRHQGKSKLVLLSRLVDHVLGDLSIEHTTYFQKLCRKKVLDRAAADGVQLPLGAATASTSVKSAPAAPVGAQPVHKAPPPAAVAAVQPPNRPPSAPPAPQRQPSTAAVGSANGPSASPPASPPPSDDNPLFVLVGELTEDPVCEEGLLKEVRLNQVLKRLWDGVAQRPKDWLAAWQAMTLPGERHAEVLQKFLNMAFVQTEGHQPEEAPQVIAELVKGHKIKMTVVENVLVAFGHNLDGVLAMNAEAWHVYAYLLLHVYPKPAKSGWGWSRVGWTWLGWWKFVEKCVTSLESSKAVDVLSMLLRLVQEREGVDLAQVWNDGGKMKQVLTKLGELGNCDENEAINRLSVEGITVDAAMEG